jgi:FMN reductase
MRAKSYSRLALQAALKIAEEHGAETLLLDVFELKLPMYLPDEPIEAYPQEHHASIERLIEGCRRSTAMLWASPTYHGTVSGAVKNALDFIELMTDDDPPYLTGRAVGLITASDPLTYGAMINSVFEVRAWLSPGYVTVAEEHFDDDGVLINERVRRRMTRLISNLMRFEMV